MIFSDAAPTCATVLLDASGEGVFDERAQSMAATVRRL